MQELYLYFLDLQELFLLSQIPLGEKASRGFVFVFTRVVLYLYLYLQELFCICICISKSCFALQDSTDLWLKKSPCGFARFKIHPCFHSLLSALCWLYS